MSESERLLGRMTIPVMRDGRSNASCRRPDRLVRVEPRPGMTTVRGAVTTVHAKRYGDSSSGQGAAPNGPASQHLADFRTVVHDQPNRLSVDGMQLAVGFL